MTNTTTEPSARDAGPDPIALTFLEVRHHIDARRAMYPDLSDLQIALATLRQANASQGREAMLLGTVATVLHFAAVHADAMHAVPAEAL